MAIHLMNLKVYGHTPTIRENPTLTQQVESLSTNAIFLSRLAKHISDKLKNSNAISQNERPCFVFRFLPDSTQVPMDFY